VLALALLAIGCGDRRSSGASAPGGDLRSPSSDAAFVARGPSAPVDRQADPPAPGDSLRALRAAAARRCHSGSAQISTAGELRSRCTVDRGCTEARGKINASDGALTLDCRGLTCSCTFEPRRDKARRNRVQFAIDRPCGLSRGARAEALWLEHCFPLLPAAGTASPAD
jgi:hypothetical protein